MDSNRWIIETSLFALWGLTSATGLLSFLAMFTIGVFVMPFAGGLFVAALLLTFRRPAREFTMSGVLLGPALWSAYLALTWAGGALLAVAGVCLVAAVLLFVLLGMRTHQRHPAAS